jgi:hypothetical protein
MGARGMELALQDDNVFVHRMYYKRKKAFENAEKMRATWIRANVNWDVTVGKSARRKRVPRKIKYDFGRWDALVDSAAKRGINVQLGLTGMAPAWATANKKIGPERPNPKLYKHFVRAAARHFKGRVHRYSPLNEPNHRGWLSPLKTQAKQYRKLYTVAYNQIKKVDPEAEVLFGELAPYASNPKNAQPPLKFLRDVACVNRRWNRVRACKLYADGFAHHPYEYHNPPSAKFPGRDNVTMSGLPKLARALDRLKRARTLRTPEGKALDIYLTEFGYFTRGKHKISEAKRAKYTVDAYRIALRNPRVRQMLYFVLVRPGRVHASFDTSLLGRGGKPGRAYRKLVSWARRAALGGLVAVAEPPPEEPAPEPEPPPEEPPPEPPPTCPVPLPPDVPCPTP